ncbi:hypothetical protein HZC31_03860 [Candidatus Woesearchaeota archaeon]|nr:hypothetical protein [Candidatus Woesearchaeota archaeon]
MAGPQQVVRPSSVPTDKVLDMRTQGLSNNQVIQILQRDGYELPAIFNALNQADIKGGIEAVPASAVPHNEFPAQETGGYPMAQQPTQQMPMQSMQQPMQQMQQGQPMGYGDQVPMLQDTGMMQDYGGMGAPEGMPQDQGMPMQPMQGPMEYPQQQNFAPPGGQSYGPSFETQRIEELAEAIIDEKWNEIVRSINKIIDWKERVEARVTKMEQQLDDMNKNFDMLHKGVLGKISEYDRNLTNVGAEIKAMDKVFQKVLPSLTENVSELSRITSGMRKK